MKKMRAKLDAAKNKGGKVWKPKIDSKTKVRLVPTPDGDPFIEKHFHYNLGKVSVLCPKRNFDEDCPVCDFASELWNSGEKESQEMAKKLFARQRFYSPIILREDKDPTVKVWGYSQTVYEKLLSKVLNPEYGDITDPESGTDFVIEYEKGAAGGYPETELEFSRAPSPLCDAKEPEKCAELLENIPDFDSLYERKSTAQVQDVLDAYLDGDEGDDSSGDKTDKVKGGGSANEKQDVSSALDDLKPKKSKKDK